jgi:phospholipid-binding lipoprotein MlaA
MLLARTHIMTAGIGMASLLRRNPAGGRWVVRGSVAGHGSSGRWRSWWRLRAAPVATASLWLLLAAPAFAQDENDPLEPVNRAVFQVNYFLDRLVLKPIALLYRDVTPQFARDGVTNFLANLSTPVVLANSILQGNAKQSELTLGRFMLNTILGAGGLVDVGGLVGMPDRRSEDFGQTLATYGVGAGPFLMLPLLGPSNPRDAAGKVVDLAFDPLFFLAPTPVTLGRFGVQTVNTREQNIENFEQLERSSLDLYAAVRTLSRQLRENEIRNGAPAPLEDIYNDDIYQLDEPDTSEEKPKAGTKEHHAR